MPLTALRELTLPTQKALTSRDQKTFLWRFHYSIEVGRAEGVTQHVSGTGGSPPAQARTPTRSRVVSQIHASVHTVSQLFRAISHAVLR